MFAGIYFLKMMAIFRSVCIGSAIWSMVIIWFLSIYFFMVVSRIIPSLISVFAHLKCWKTLVVQGYIWVFHDLSLYYEEFYQAYPSLIPEWRIHSTGDQGKRHLPSRVGKVFYLFPIIIINHDFGISLQ